MQGSVWKIGYKAVRIGMTRWSVGLSCGASSFNACSSKKTSQAKSNRFFKSMKSGDQIGKLTSNLCVGQNIPMKEMSIPNKPSHLDCHAFPSRWTNCFGHWDVFVKIEIHIPHLINPSFELLSPLAFIELSS